MDSTAINSEKIKESNPKDALGISRVPFSTIPSEVVAEIGLALLEGALKYGRHNWRSVGVRTSVYVDACHRHLAQFWEGEDIDQDSGLHHITKAIACLVVLRDAMFVGKCLDDRPPKLEDGWVADMNAKAKALIERYPQPTCQELDIDGNDLVAALSQYGFRIPKDAVIEGVEITLSKPD